MVDLLELHTLSNLSMLDTELDAGCKEALTILHDCRSSFLDDTRSRHLVLYVDREVAGVSFVGLPFES